MEQINKLNYVNQVYEQLNAMISNGSLSEGSKLPSEMVLSRELNVSRSVVREALQSLRAEHKIITHQGMGSYCANPLNYEIGCTLNDTLTEAEFRQFQAFRAALECGAVIQASSNHTQKDILALETHLQGMRDNSSIEKYTQEDEAFHHGIYLASHNQIMIKAYEAVRPEVYRVLNYLNQHKGSQNISNSFHQRLYECIRDNLPTEAVRLIKSHDEYNIVRVAEYQKLMKQSDE